MNGSALIVILAAVLGLVSATFLPEAEDPWPDTVGLGFPFTLAGAGGALGLVLAMVTRLPPREQDALVRRGSVFGFTVGLGFYVVALIVQVL